MAVSRKTMWGIVAVIIVIIIVAAVAVIFYRPAERKVTWATIAGFYTDWAETISENFTTKTGIKVDVIGIDYSVMYEKQMIELAGKTGAYDIVTIETMCLAEWANAGWLANLSTYIAKTPEADINFTDILEHYRWLLRWNGTTYGLPYYTYDQGVHYRADIFENTTIKQWYHAWATTPALRNPTYEDTVNWPIVLTELRKPNHQMNWSEFENMARFFFEETRDPVLYGVGLMAGPVESNDEWMAIMWGLGGDHFNSTYAITVNATQSVRAMEIYMRLLKYAPPGALASSYDEVVAQMRAGKIPMTGPFYLDQWPNMVKTEDSISGAKMECATPVGGRGYIGCFALGIDAASKRKDDAWEFLKWLTGPTGQYSFAKGGGTTCRKSVLLNPEFDPAVNPATRRYTAHYKAVWNASQLWLQTAPTWQKPPRVFKIPVAGKMYLESKITIGAIAAGQLTPKGGLDKLALAYATILGWGYPVPSQTPPAGWQRPPED
mgnify:CR=1 FL=1